MIELRWLQRPDEQVQHEDGFKTFKNVPVLQYRWLMGLPSKQWSDWQAVPTVRNEKGGTE